ncbi:MAG: hypothetical protein HYX38_18345 [Rhodospirillales bacterium]|nr:hypothetical protein [Rhodospirillales bacterium]
MTIIDEEFDAVQKVFGLNRNIAGSGYFVGDPVAADEWNIALVQASDRSNVPVANEVRSFMEDLRPEVLILVGIAGGLCDEGKGRDGIQPGDVLIADQVSYVEFLKIDSKKGVRLRTYAIDHPSVPLRKSVGMPISKQFKIAEAAEETLPTSGSFKIHIGSIVSGEKVLGDVKSHVQQQLLEPFDKALAVDMESIGMARAICDGRDSFWYHPRYAIIRGISDLVSDANNDDQRADWKPIAAYVAALVAQQFSKMCLMTEGR